MSKLIVDSREPLGFIFPFLDEENIEYSCEELNSGDFILSVEKGIAVERKEVNDFVSSIMDRRLFNQVAKMKVDYDNPIIIIEGDIHSVRSAIDMNAIRGALSWISVIEGVTVHHTSSLQDTCKTLAIMHRHATEGLGYEVPLRANKPKDLSSSCQYLVEGLPSCGPATAKKLLQFFGSPFSVFTASKDELLSVPGIGKKMANKITEALRYTK